MPSQFDWTREELILALDLYFRHNPKTITRNDPVLFSLSDLLRKLGAARGLAITDEFRSNNSVYTKLYNFLAIDPSIHEAGLQSYSRNDERVFQEFADRREDLVRVAEAIRRNAPSDDPSLLPPSTEPLIETTEEMYPEGRVLYLKHRTYERNRKAVSEKKAHARKSTGLRCEVCDFSFSEAYGEIGVDFIECHHKIPVSQMAPGQKTRPQDLALVCSNCHRMLHRGPGLLTVEDLRKRFRSPRSGIAKVAAAQQEP